MLRPVWSRVDSVLRSASFGRPLAPTNAGRASWPASQIRRSRLYRTIRLYNWFIGVSGAIVALCVKLIGSRLPPALQSPDVVFGAWSLLDRYVQDLIVANFVVLGVVIVRGAWPRPVLHLLKEFARRHAKTGADAVEPSLADGALLTFRVALIAPAIILGALLATEHHPARFVERGMHIALTLIAIAAFGAAAGAAAVYIRRSVRRYAVVAWLGLWLVPELVRAVVPVAPTPRSMIDDVLTSTSLNREMH